MAKGDGVDSFPIPRKGKTLLEQARAVKSVRSIGGPVSDEVVELVWAWCCGIVSKKQAASVLGISEQRLPVRLLEVMQRLVERGDLEPSAMLRDIEKGWTE
ncbi:MAG TPA: hypothetical protein VFH61_04095 [Thermoleophilia bacterium]|nr:hypothetical protein [Thermoleophilia bacterium]